MSKNTMAKGRYGNYYKLVKDIVPELQCYIEYPLDHRIEFELEDAELLYETLRRLSDAFETNYIRVGARGEDQGEIWDIAGIITVEIRGVSFDF